MYWTRKVLDEWISANRPHLSSYEDDGRRGYYEKSAGPAASFHVCGSRWRDVARELGAEDAEKSSGTAPDTPLHLGPKRRTWLKEHGGPQPTICAMIDRAMKSQSVEIQL